MNKETVKTAASKFCEKHELYGSSNICNLYATPLSEWSNKAFIAGAAWQKQQEANGAIEFATQVMQQKFNYLVGKSYEKLYELWKQTKE